MVRRTKEDAEQTREAILEAAGLVFAEKGVANASLDEIARRATVTRGAVYWHFENKIAIYRALIQQVHTPFIDRILRDLERNDPRPLHQLEMLCIELMQDLVHNKPKQRVLRIMLLEGDFSGEMEVLLHEKNQQKLEKYAVLARYFEQAQSKGQLSPNADPHTLAIALMCYLSGIALEYIRCTKLVNLTDHAPMMMRIFFNGLRTGCST